MYFHLKFAWPPATYDVMSRDHTNWPSLNLSQNVLIYNRLIYNRLQPRYLRNSTTCKQFKEGIVLNIC